jgi:hypothetical protein
MSATKVHEIPTDLRGFRRAVECPLLAVNSTGQRNTRLAPAGASEGPAGRRVARRFALRSRNISRPYRIIFAECSLFVLLCVRLFGKPGNRVRRKRAGTGDRSPTWPVVEVAVAVAVAVAATAALRPALWVHGVVFHVCIFGDRATGRLGDWATGRSRGRRQFPAYQGAT